MLTSPPDWQLPPGVNRGLWDYLHDPGIAANYDAGLAGNSLFDVDRRFVEEHFARPGRLLDLGCGTGRLLVPFAQRGFWVLGVDLSEEMLKKAAQRSAREGVAVHLLKANLVQLQSLQNESFDYAACLFSTFGMIAGSAARRRFLEHVYRLVHPGGLFVLHVHNRWFNLWNQPGRRWLLRDCLGLVASGCERGDRLMPVHQGIAGLTLHLFTRREVRRALQQAGFRLLEIRPVSLSPDGKVSWHCFFGWLRSYGYLLAAERPA